MTPGIPILPGLARAGSFNSRLAEEAARLLALTDTALTTTNPADYPLPIFDTDGRTADGGPRARLDRLLEQLVDHGPALARHA